MKLSDKRCRLHPSSRTQKGEKMPSRLYMLGICRQVTPYANVMKLGTVGLVGYVIALTAVGPHRLTGFGVSRHPSWVPSIDKAHRAYYTAVPATAGTHDPNDAQYHGQREARRLYSRDRQRTVTAAAQSVSILKQPMNIRHCSRILQNSILEDTHPQRLPRHRFNSGHQLPASFIPSIRTLCSFISSRYRLPEP